jgi:hypothetical protein
MSSTRAVRASPTQQGEPEITFTVFPIRGNRLTMTALALTPVLAAGIYIGGGALLLILIIILLLWVL